MVQIFDAIRVDPLNRTTRLYRGTKDYLDKIGATLVYKSGREVPDHHVDAEGRYLNVKDA